MTSLPALLFTVLLPAVTGALVARFLCRKTRLTAIFALAAGYGLGCGLLGQWMLIAGILKIPYTLFWLALPLLLISVSLVLFQPTYTPGVSRGDLPRGVSRRVNSMPLAAGHKLTPGQKLLAAGALAFIASHIVLAFWRALIVPIMCWDGLYFIAFDAKVFFLKQGLYQHHHLPHPSYPLQVSFLQTWTALNLGRWDEQLTKIIFPGCFLAYLGVHYTFLRVQVSRLWALGGVALLLTSALFTFHATIEYRDLFMAFFNCGAVFLLLMRERVDDDGLLLMAGLFSGFMTFTKLEGLLYLAIHVCVLGWFLLGRKNQTTRQKIRQALLFLTPAAGICALYFLYKALAGVPLTERADIAMAGVVPVLDRLPRVLTEFWEEMLVRGNWNVVWFLWLISLARWRVFRQYREILILLGTVGLFITSYILLTLFTANFVWLAGKSAHAGISRVFLHFYPLAAATLVLIHAPRSD